MIADVGAFLDWFDGVHRRTVRDVRLLPPEAESWSPPPAVAEGEASWTIGQIVRHLIEARSYFVGAFLGQGWVWDTFADVARSRDEWEPALEHSASQVRERLADVPTDQLRRRIELIAAPERTISAWRALMMMSEHEIAHRAQISTYAGLNGWPVAQIFDRENEWVVAQRADQIARFRSTP